MKIQRPAYLVLIGASVFAIGASLVVISLHSHSNTPTVAGRQAAGTALGRTTAVGQAPTVNTSEVAIPTGDQAVAVTPTTGSAALAGYLGPGDVVDVYATSKTATPSAFAPTCAVLVASNVPVLDVSQQTAEYRGHAGAARTVPASVTVLLGAKALQAPVLVFAAQNEQIYLTEVPTGNGSGAPAAPVAACGGAG